MRQLVLMIMVLILLQSAPVRALELTPEEYPYPFEDPFLATVAGSPTDEIIPQPLLEQETYDLVLYENRPLPPLLKGLREYEFSLAYQDGPAPLIFVIAGTGANYKSGKVKFMESVFWNAGFHVVSLSSTFSRHFAAQGASSQIPGISMQDAQDLYRLMRQAWDLVREEIEVTGFYLTGYSLGGLNSAFLSYIDETERAFNFRKVLMINPPVNLYASARRLDQFVEENLKEGADVFFDRLMVKVSRYFQYKGAVTIDDEFLYDIYHIDPPTQSDLAALIGVAFRFSLANVVFSVDLLINGGHIVPKERVLRLGDSTTVYFKRALNWTFARYAEEILLPYWRKTHPGDSIEDLIRQISLTRLEAYLKQAEKIGLVHNVDDVILGPGDIEFFRRTFGDRALIYPNGGHCGNLTFPPNVEYMVNFFTEDLKLMLGRVE